MRQGLVVRLESLREALNRCLGVGPEGEFYRTLVCHFKRSVMRFLLLLVTKNGRSDCKEVSPCKVVMTSVKRATFWGTMSKTGDWMRYGNCIR